MIKEKTINNINVKPLVNADAVEIDKIRGGKLFPELYGVTYLSSRRKSGKTSVLAEILKRTTDKKTVIWIFCPTHRIDPSWIQIIEYLENKGNTINCFDSMIEGKTNLLDEIVTDLSNPTTEEKKDKKNDEIPITKVCFENPENEKTKGKPYKPKKKAPEHIFIFDDISQELKNVGLLALLKKSRHLKASVYISSQYLLDLQPAALKQLSFFLCFRSMTREKLEHIYKMLDLSVDIEKFYELYDFATKDPYCFLYIDMKNQKFRKNFSKELLLEEI
jgi:hypothetical protein